jgi:hypothetical protein
MKFGEMTNLLAAHSLVTAQYIEQQWPYPGTLSAEDVDAIDIADKDCLFRPSLRLRQRKLKNTRVRLLYANSVRVDYYPEELFYPALPQDRSDATICI